MNRRLYGEHRYKRCGIRGFASRIAVNFIWAVFFLCVGGLRAETKLQQPVFDVVPAEMMQVIEKAYALNKKGLSKLDAGDFDGAYRYFSAALDTFPGYTDAKNNIGVVYYRRGIIGQAQRVWRELTKAYPTYFLSWYNLATVALHERRFEMALQRADSVLSLNKNFYQAWMLKGKAYLEMKKHRKAVRAFKKAFSIVPDNKACWSNYAYALVQAGDTTGAVKVLRTYKDDPEALRMRGILYAVQGRHGDAISSFSRAYEQTRDTTMLLRIAHMQFEQGKYCEALKEYSRYFRHSGSKPVDAFINASYAARSCKSDTAALRILREGYAFYSNDPVLNYNIGTLSFALKDYDRALFHLSRAADTLSNPHLHYLRAKAAFLQGDYASAISYIDNALGIARRASYFDLKGRIYYARGDKKKAMEAFSAALSEDSSYVQASLHYALASGGDSLTDYTRIRDVLQARLDTCSDGNQQCASLRKSLSFIYYESGDIARVLDMLERIESSRWKSRLYSMLGTYYRDRTQPDSAVRMLKRCVANSDTASQCLHTLAQLYIERGMEDSAVVLLTRFEKRKGNGMWKMEYQLGHAFLKSNRLEKARRAFKSSLERNPGYAPAMALLAFVYAREGREDTARSLWQQARKDGEANATVIKNIGISFEEAGMYDSALHYYHHALHLDPGDSALYINIGNTYAVSGDTTAATQAYKTALSSGKRAEAAYNLFLIARARTNDKLARQMKKVLVNEFPRHVYASRVRVDWHLWQQDTAAAYEVLQGIDDKNEHDMYQLCQIAMAMNDDSVFSRYISRIPDDSNWAVKKIRLKAEFAFSRQEYTRSFNLLQQLPDTGYSALYNKALAAFHAGMCKKALVAEKKIGRRALADEQKERLLSLKANAAMCTQHWSVARSVYDTLAQISPDDPVVWYNRAVALYNMDSVKTAWNFYTRAIEMDSSFVNEDIEHRYKTVTTPEPSSDSRSSHRALKGTQDSIVALYNRAVSLQGNGEKQRALVLYRRILSLDSTHVRTMNNMGVLFARKGAYDSASHYYSRVLRYEPGMTQTYVNLISVQLMRGDSAQAREIFARLKTLQADSALLEKAAELFEPAVIR